MNTTQKKGRNISVTIKLLIPVFVIVLLVIGIQTWLNINNTRQQIELEIQHDMQILYDGFNEESETISKGAASLSLAFADRDDIKELFLAKDRAGLLALLTPIFDTMATDYNMRHLYVHEPDGSVFVRIHNPKKFGDDITYRRTAEVALQTQKTVHGIEIGPNRLGIRSVSPLLQQGELIGLLEVGFDFDQAFLDTFKADHKADYTIWVADEPVALANIEPTDDALESPLSELFFYAGTNRNPLPIPAEVYNRVLQSGEEEVQFVSDGNQEQAVLVAPMLAYGDRVIGILEISQLHTQVLENLRNDQLLILAVAGILALVSLTLMWWIITIVILRPVHHLTAIAHHQIEGNLNARVELPPDDEFGQLGITLNTLTEELDDTLKNQDAVITSRTDQLQVALDVAQRLSSILDFEKLLEEVVNLIHDRFALYHTHIYLLDDARENLVMVEGYGQAGAEMKSQDHNIPLHTQQSLVAQSARSGEVVRINNVRIEASWLPNPLLPETRSEMAVPVKLEGKVMGVLDVQSNQEDTFDEQFGLTLRSVADEIAVAVRNAQIFTETTQALAEAQKIEQLYAQSGWQDYNTRQKTNVYQQIQPGVGSIDDSLLAQIKQNVTQGQTVVTTSAPSNGGDSNPAPATLATPLAVRGQVVGHIRIHDTEQERQWSVEEIALLESISEQMSLAIENARLFDDTQQRAAREQLAREITDKMRAEPDIDSIIETGLGELAKSLGVSRTYVKLSTKIKDKSDDHLGPILPG